MYKPAAPSVFCGAIRGATWYFVMPCICIYIAICTETSRVTTICMALWSGHGWFYIQALWEFPIPGMENICDRAWENCMVLSTCKI